MVPGLAPSQHGSGQGTTLATDPNTGNVFAAPYTVYNRYTKFDISYIGGKLDATWAINTKKYGDHELKFGGEYRYNTLKKIDFFPAATANNPKDSLGNLQTNPQNLWFGRDVLLNSYGYDVRDQYGNQIVSGDDINPKHPIIGAFYVRDKVDFQFFTANLGVRIDYLNVNTDVLKDPYVLIGSTGQLLSDDVYQKSKANINVSPRLGFSFPVTENTIFVANYGKFIQMPDLQYLYINKLAFKGYFQNSVQNIAENSDLVPEKLTSYEIGFKQKVSDVVDFGVTAYYRETKDEIGTNRINGSSTVPSAYAIYANTDFSSSKGLDFYFSLRRTNRVAVDVSYTLLYASGVGSDPNSKAIIATAGSSFPKFQFPADYDQRHTGNINIDYRFGGDNDVPKGWLGQVLKYAGLNVLFKFNSGRPYTARLLPSSAFNDDGQPLTTHNQVYRGWNLDFDLKLDKGFNIWKTRWDAYIYVINLFNSELVESVYGSTGLPGDNGYLLTPTGSASPQVFKDNFNERIKNIGNWGSPRQIRFGLKMNF